MGQYYMIECFEPDDWEDSAVLSGVPSPQGESSWRFGRPFQTIPNQPILIPMLETHCERLLDFYNTDALLIKRSLFEALKEVGVDNIDAYDTLIRHPVSGYETTDYIAGNLIGIISAADLAASTVVSGSHDGLLDVDFDSVTIDNKKVKGALMFRLVENTSAVVIHKKVKEFLESRGFDQLRFFLPEDWMG